MEHITQVLKIRLLLKKMNYKWMQYDFAPGTVTNAPVLDLSHSTLFFCFDLSSDDRVWLEFFSNRYRK